MSLSTQQGYLISQMNCPHFEDTLKRWKEQTDDEFKRRRFLTHLLSLMELVDKGQVTTAEQITEFDVSRGSGLAMTRSDLELKTFVINHLSSLLGEEDDNNDVV